MFQDDTNNKVQESKKNNDYILLIFNCLKYRYKALKQKETWLPSIPNKLLYFHVLGDPVLEKDYIIDEESHILYVKTDDDYNSLPKKVVAAFAAIHSVYNFKYIFKTDDDQTVSSENIRFFQILMNTLDTKANAKKPEYGGNIITVHNPYKSEYYRLHPELPKNLIVMPTKYCSGRFYFLSREAVESLIEPKTRDKIHNEYLEDYAIGYNIPNRLKTNMMHLDTSKYFMDSSF